MPEPKLTPEGLPVVTEGSIDSFIRDVGSNAFNFTKAYQLIEKHNPLLAYTINEFVKQSGEESGVTLLPNLISIYELLRRQAETNQLENTVNNTEKRSKNKQKNRA